MHLLNMKNMAVAALSIYTIPNMPSAFATPTDQGLSPAENVAREYIMTTAKYQLSTGETPSTTAVVNSASASPSASSIASTSRALNLHASAWSVGLVAAGGTVAVLL
ncbi:unnamed protein product [Cyclocybe aegerita]|uniref:Uncharacterized protein n=1 Tax=Cyclocybe aegerita TaxID=1973307 RepID=A0A8S0W1F1_CYCAE|nr:unnamed protein product [Cyclocybe aegerita]